MARGACRNVAALASVLLSPMFCNAYVNMPVALRPIRGLAVGSPSMPCSTPPHRGSSRCHPPATFFRRELQALDGGHSAPTSIFSGGKDVDAGTKRRFSRKVLDVLVALRNRLDTIRSSGYYGATAASTMNRRDHHEGEGSLGEDGTKCLPVVMAGTGRLWLLVIAFLIFRRIRRRKSGGGLEVDDPSLKYMVLTKEQDKTLKAYQCKNCGSILFSSKAREVLQWKVSQKECFTCGTKGDENFIEVREDIVSEVEGDEDPFEPDKKPLDYLRKGDRRRLLKDANGDEALANQMAARILSGKDPYAEDDEEETVLEAEATSLPTATATIEEEDETFAAAEAEATTLPTVTATIEEEDKTFVEAEAEAEAEAISLPTATATIEEDETVAGELAQEGEITEEVTVAEAEEIEAVESEATGEIQSAESEGTPAPVEFKPAPSDSVPTPTEETESSAGESVLDELDMDA